MPASAPSPLVYASNDLSVYQGDDYAARVIVTNPDGTDADLTGYVAKAQIRRDVADIAVDVEAEFVCTIDPPNVIAISLANTDTAALSGSLRWDLQLTSSAGMVTTIVAGAVAVTPEVTR